jgi:dihydroxyacetone kinase-like protein
MTDDTFDARLARAWLAATAVSVEAHRGELTELDAAIGDGDHGTNLSRGFAAVTEVLAGPVPRQGGDTAGGSDADGENVRESAGHPLVIAGSALISKVGGASGPLYGSAFRAIGKALNSADADGVALLDALVAGLEAICRLGGASVGDKTMVDAFTPAIDAFGLMVDAGSGLAAATLAAADAAEAGAADTVELLARKGRASYLGPRSVGHQDPGATSTALVFRALADVTAPRA